jgi:hypothetical protein
VIMKRRRMATVVSFVALGFVLAGCGGMVEVPQDETKEDSSAVKIYKDLYRNAIYTICVDGKKYLIVYTDSGTTTNPLDGSTC